MRRRLLSLLCAAFVVCLASGASATTTNANVNTAAKWCFGLIGMNGSTAVNGQQGLISPLVECFTDTKQGIIPTVTTSFIAKTKNDYLNVIWLMCLLAVAYYGIRLMLGDVRQLKAETVILGLKLAGIAFFVDNAATIYIDMVNILQSLSQTISNAATNVHGTGFCVGNGGSAAGSGSAVSASPTDNSQWQQGLWQRWDCIFSYLLGFSSVGFAAASIASFIYLMLFSLSSGIMVAVFALGVILSLLTTAFRFIHIYLMSVLALSFMFCIGYLFVPLILFRGVFYEYFRKWIVFVFGFILTPVIMFGFMGMMLIALDIALFSGKYAVFCEIGGAGACGTNTTAGAKLFSNIASNTDITGEMGGTANSNLSAGFLTSFYIPVAGEQSITTTGSLTGTAAAALSASGGVSPPSTTFQNAGMGGFWGNLLNGTGGGIMPGSTYDSTIHPGMARVGVSQTLLNISHLATAAGSTCTSSSIGGTGSFTFATGSAAAAPVTIFNNCPWIENILISLCVAGLLIYIMSSLLSFIPTLASNLTRDMVSNDVLSGGAKLAQSAVFGESGGRGLLDSVMNGAQGGKERTGGGAGGFISSLLGSD